MTNKTSMRNKFWGKIKFKRIITNKKMIQKGKTKKLAQ